MSTILLGLVWSLRLPPTRKSVLVSLADQANDEGYCWPSLETICKRTCLGRTCVIESISSLEQSGYLQANRENGRRTTYTLTIGQELTSSLRGPVHQAHRSATRTKPVRQADTKQHEPSGCCFENNNNQVHTPAELAPDLLTRGLLSAKEYSQIMQQMATLPDQARSQALVDELAGALRARGRIGDRGIKNPARFLSSLLCVSTDQLTYALSEAELRAARAAASAREAALFQEAPRPPERSVAAKPTPEILSQMASLRAQIQLKNVRQHVK